MLWFNWLSSVKSLNGYRYVEELLSPIMRTRLRELQAPKLFVPSFALLCVGREEKFAFALKANSALLNVDMHFKVQIVKPISARCTHLVCCVRSVLGRNGLTK